MSSASQEISGRCGIEDFLGVENEVKVSLPSKLP